RIDPAVGLVMKKRVGDPVEKGEIWCELHVNPASDVAAARRLLEGALTVSPRPVAAPELVHAVIE
ncbi:MAG: pyrimidine-nucleoside phosphorylase, partial [Clostridia bacterium]|nr:pyrimidine-nucleoside phosphorylase [Clostridia bacterium]